MGAWACATCAEQLGLDGAGNARAERGFCGAGWHDAGEIRWFDEAIHPAHGTEAVRPVERKQFPPAQIEMSVSAPSNVEAKADIGHEPRGLSAGKAPISAAAVTPEGQMDMFGPNHEPLRGAP